MKRWLYILLLLAALAGGWCLGVLQAEQVRWACQVRQAIFEAERDAWEGGRHD